MHNTLQSHQTAFNKRENFSVQGLAAATTPHVSFLPNGSDLIAAAMQRHASDIPPGWHCLLRRSLFALQAMANSSERRAALTTLSVFSDGVELRFSLCADADAALRGTVRKAQMSSRSICRDCGRAGKPREIGEEGKATLCPRCAAPILLREDIWQLQQSIGFLRSVNVPVVAHQIPGLLRASFRQEAAGHPEDHGPTGQGRMSAARFLVWAARLQSISERIGARQ